MEASRCPYAWSVPCSTLGARRLVSTCLKLFCLAERALVTPCACGRPGIFAIPIIEWDYENKIGQQRKSARGLCSKNVVSCSGFRSNSRYLTPVEPFVDLKLLLLLIAQLHTGYANM
eukprot:911533-Rhodomonas_salina.2